jgi:hypothetical protein
MPKFNFKVQPIAVAKGFGNLLRFLAFCLAHLLMKLIISQAVNRFMPVISKGKRSRVFEWTELLQRTGMDVIIFLFFLVVGQYILHGKMTTTNALWLFIETAGVVVFSVLDMQYFKPLDAPPKKKV